MTHRGETLLVAFIVLTAVLACGSRTLPPPAPPSPARVASVVLSDGGCTSDAVLFLDRLDVELVNDTGLRARFDLWRLYDGHSYAEFVAAVAEDNRRLAQGQVGVGAFAFAELLTVVDVAAARRVRLQEELIPGNYTVSCWRPRGTQGVEIIAGGSFAVR